MIYSFEQVVKKKDGFLRGPFGSALKKTLFVPKGKDTIKVYEQSVPLEQDETLGHYYISREYFVNSMFRFEVKPNDFLISCSGVNYGAIYQLSNNAEHGVINQALLRVRLNNDVIDDNYFLYLFKSLIMKKITSGTGDSTIPNFPSMDIVKKIEFDLPELIRQKKVGFILSFIDKKIVNNNKINAELESMAKTLYDYWFLQFEFPNEDGKPYKSSGGKMVYNKELKREIPEGWKVENLMDSTLCKDIKAGVDYFDYKNYLPTANIDGENITEGENVTYDNRENRANMQPIKYSVWFAKMKNSIKHLTIPNNSDWFIEKYILSTGFQGLKCSVDSLSFIHCIVNSVWFENYKDVLSHGATQEGVNNDDLKNIKFAVPTNNILKQFSNIVLPLLERKFSIIKENQELTSLRDFLLPLLMNGQVTFKE
ncbi:MAG: restriction endonuclease subunit S [Vulcanibacillus sp.]